MISNQILQNTIEGLKNITHVNLCVLDATGKILVSTGAKPEGLTRYAKTFVKTQATQEVTTGYQLFKIYDEYQLQNADIFSDGIFDARDIVKLKKTLAGIQ